MKISELDAFWGGRPPGLQAAPSPPAEDLGTRWRNNAFPIGLMVDSNLTGSL